MVSGGRALDAGTGTGQYLKILDARGIRSVGLDLSLEMLRRARLHVPKSKTVCGSVQYCPFKNETFDLVLACRVLSHVPNLELAFSELARITKPSGRAIFSDVSASHNYEATRIPTPRGDVHIETYKHSNEKIASMATQSGFWAIEFLRDVHFRDLTVRPDAGEYPSIDESSNLPIFVYGVLSRISS
jgi:ubiquinone/menaquinone biosynthesis C-methylase UbiE